MKWLQVDAGEAQAAYAFFHLTGDFFWMLCYHNVSDCFRTSGDVSPSAIRQKVRHAIIKDTYWRALTSENACRQALDALGRQWWPGRVAVPPHAFWWVNQGHTYSEERSGGFIFAPQKDQRGSELYHWTNVSKVKKGDMVFHYANGALRAHSRAISDGQEADKPDSPLREGWVGEGWRVELDYHDLPQAIPLSEVVAPLSALGLERGPITATNGIKQGYLFELNEEAAKILLEKCRVPQPKPWPPVVVQTTPMLKNVILYGPPGTGKTYTAVQMAVEICNGMAPPDRAELGKQFRHLLNEQRVAFVTFHQSYGYEDFVEGIRPVLSQEGEGEAATGAVDYECRDGVFKRMCSLARAARAKSGSSNSIPDDVTVWKMSLGHYRDPRQAYVYEECLEKNYVLLGYGQGLDFTGCDDRDAVLARLREQDPEIRPTDYHVTSVNMFKNEMKEGDLVVISEGNNKFRAIARLTGEYQFLRPEDYGQMRPVEWLAVYDSSLPRETITNKLLSEMTIYRMAQRDLKLEALRDLLDSQQGPEERNYVVIIDEINRGNISKVLGELITLLEPDKRLGAENELTATLPYSGDEFGVPSNLFVLGTMNTADRSIAFIDTALRRRFDFKEMMPDPGIVRRTVGGGTGTISGVNVAELLIAMNHRIEYLFDRDHQIGHSYLMKATSLLDLREVFLSRIIPLLQEYFYGDWAKLCVVLNCPYDTEGATPTTANPQPIIIATPLGAGVLAGFDRDELEERFRYEVSSDFVEATGDRLVAFLNRVIRTDASTTSGTEEEQP